MLNEQALSVILEYPADIDALSGLGETPLGVECPNPNLTPNPQGVTGGYGIDVACRIGNLNCMQP